MLRIEYAISNQNEGDKVATIRKLRGKKGTTYNVQVRLGEIYWSETFKTYEEAKIEGLKKEAELRENRDSSVVHHIKKTLSEAIGRYRDLILPNIRKSRREHIIAWWEKNYGRLPLRKLTPEKISEIKQKLSREEIGGNKRAPATVIKYLATLSSIMTFCIKELRWLTANPVQGVSKPKLPKGRTRYLDEHERCRLFEACQKSSNPFLYAIARLALTTGARRGEILKLTWNDVDFERRIVWFLETKNSEDRVSRLEKSVIQLLEDQKKSATSQLIFPSNDPQKPIDFRSAWRVAVKRAQLNDFKFHDLRHTFASLCKMRGMDSRNVGVLLGHKSISSTDRYCHLAEPYQLSLVDSMHEEYFGGFCEG